MRWVRCLWQINIAGLNDREIKRVVDEIRLLKKLKHPYLIKFDSAFTKGSDRIIFITELMTSGTLQEPLPPPPPHPLPSCTPVSCRDPASSTPPVGGAGTRASAPKRV